MCDDDKIDEKDEAEVSIGAQRGPKSLAALLAEVRLLRRLLDELVDRPVVLWLRISGFALKM